MCVSDQVAGAARDDPAAAGRGDQAEDPVSPPPADLPHRAEQVRYSTVQYSTVQYSTVASVMAALLQWECDKTPIPSLPH